MRNLQQKLYLALAIIAIVFFTLTIRGNVGNPTPEQIDKSLNHNGQAFETSQERSRYALILSMYYDHAFSIDNYASMGTPDIGFIKGHFFSFFPPGASVLALPLFVVGQQLGIAQLAVFSITTLFSFFTMLLIIRFCYQLKLHWSICLLAAISFGFATNAWGYSVTFYAHVISSFFILLGLYSLLFMKNWRGALLFWLCYSVGVYLDFPNLFIFFPMAVVQGLRFFQLDQKRKHFELGFKWMYLFTPLLFVILMVGYGFYNYTQFGSPTILSNTIPRVKDLKEISQSSPEGGREAVGALNTRNMLEGFNSFLISNDRGVLFYTPIAFLSILGIGVLAKKNKEKEVLLFTVPLTCLVLYTMFGDPYGGWAFGSRYILAIMPELMILVGLGLAKFAKNIWVKLLYSVVFVYSSAVSLLAPLTTNVIPPYVEARYLNLKSNYLVNIDMLKRNELNSFFFNNVLHKSIPGIVYYILIAVLIASVGLYLIWVRKPVYENAN